MRTLKLLLLCAALSFAAPCVLAQSQPQSKPQTATPTPAAAAAPAPAAAPASIAAPFKDPSPHSSQLVDVGDGVKLEVLDWGGRGRPFVLLAGVPHTAHVFDDFAPRLARSYHVYGITRRGFGRSSAPQTGYTSDELAGDVLKVIESLHLQRPIVAGHSLGGLELTSIASRAPGKVAGVVYLDGNFSGNPQFEASLWYARRDWRQHLDDLREKIAILQTEPHDPDETIRELIGKTWPVFQMDLETFLAANRARPPFPPATADDRASYAAVRAWYFRGNGVELPEAEFREILATEADGRPKISFRQPAYVNAAIAAGKQQYTTPIDAPALAVFAIWDKAQPFDPGDQQAKADAAAYADTQAARVALRVEEFRKLAPKARVIEVHRASHYVFLSNEAEVLAAINEFAASLK
jgi:pimeloyl-ACP methyl ester carboxylesterase